jgi:hypothetical protein
MVDNHTYTLSAPDPFVAPYFDLLLDRTPKEQPPPSRATSERTSTRTDGERRALNAELSD